MTKLQHYNTTLTIAGSDSCGGAGAQANLKTFSDLGCYGLSVITVLTAQNTQGVQAIKRVPAKFILHQMRSLFHDIHINATKTGLLLSAEIIHTVAATLRAYKHQPLIVDPAMIGKDKRVLLATGAVRAMVAKLFPLATLVTPNIDEAEYLLNMAIYDRPTMQIAATQISDLGARAVLVKGGHLNKMQESVDCLYLKQEQKFYWFSRPRVATNNTHGAGCTLSAAITAFMAQGHELLPAIHYAKQYITQVIVVGKQYRLGAGLGPTCHFHQRFTEP